MQHRLAGEMLTAQEGSQSGYDQWLLFGEGAQQLRREARSAKLHLEAEREELKAQTDVEGQGTLPPQEPPWAVVRRSTPNSTALSAQAWGSAVQIQALAFTARTQSSSPD